MTDDLILATILTTVPRAVWDILSRTNQAGVCNPQHNARQQHNSNLCAASIQLIMN